MYIDIPKWFSWFVFGCTEILEAINKETVKPIINWSTSSVVTMIYYTNM